LAKCGFCQAFAPFGKSIFILGNFAYLPLGIIEFYA
jgi:hypothetical protein